MQIFQEGEIQWRESERVAEKILEKDRQKARERERDDWNNVLKNNNNRETRLLGGFGETVLAVWLLFE